MRRQCAVIVVGALTLLAVPAVADAARHHAGAGATADYSQPADPAEQLLFETGSKSCTVTAITATREQSGFVIVGAQATSSVSEAVTDDRQKPWEVTLSQGTAAGVQLSLGPKDPPIAGSAVATALFGFDSSSIYDLATKADADRIVAFGKDPLHNPDALPLMGASEQWSYSGGDHSFGGSITAYGFLTANAGLGSEAGDAHSRDGYTQHITTVNRSLGAEVDLGLSAQVDLNATLIQAVLMDPNGRIVGVTDKTTIDDSGAVGFATPEMEMKLKPEGEGGPVGDATRTFALKAGHVGVGVLDEVDGTVAFNQPAIGARGVMDLLHESPGFPEAVQVAASVDLVRLMGSDGFVTVRRSVVDKSTTGIALDVGLGVDVSLDFSGTDESTSLLDASVVHPDSTLTPWTDCQQAAAIHLPTVQGPLPGIGATMHDWLGAHTADPANTKFVADDVCAPSASPDCSGQFASHYDPGTPQGDLFVFVDPAAGSSCPIPFVASARAAEEQSCRVAEMVIMLPHAVSTPTADALARSQLPADVTVAAPPPSPGTVLGEISCQRWRSPTLAGLTELGDPDGVFAVGYFSHSVDISPVIAAPGTSGPNAPYNPNDIVGIVLQTGVGRLAAC